MAVPSLDTQLEGSSDRHPLLMDRSENSTGAPENDDRHEHVIDIARGGITSSSASRGDGHNDCTELQSENMPSSSTQAPASQSSGLSAAVSNSRNTGPTRRGDNYVRRHRSPLNSGLWICIELVVNLSQIIASIIVLSLSRHEKPQTPLFEWIIGYTAGCVATLPHLYWRYTHRNNYGNSQDSARPQPGSTAPIETTYTAITVTQAPSADDLHSAAAAPQSEENTRTTNPRLNSLVDHFKMALDCFFAVWFVVGNVWIFGGHSSATSAPNMYRLCIVFLTFSCIGYAMPFILCATICCCLPCIISVLGFREDLGQNRGATPEIINTLPTYKFKSKRTRNRDDSENNADGPGEGGILAAGTEKERTISGEDAVCCICLAKYVDNDELRELPCTHFFHMECVDKWLKINALCPLCKSDIGEASGETSGTGRG